MVNPRLVSASTVAIVHTDDDLADVLQLALDQADIPAYTLVLDPAEPSEAARRWLRPEIGLVVVGITAPLQRSQALLQLLRGTLPDAPLLALSPVPTALGPRLGVSVDSPVQLSPDLDETVRAVLNVVRQQLPPLFALRLRAAHARHVAQRLATVSATLYQRAKLLGMHGGSLTRAVHGARFTFRLPGGGGG